MNNIYCLNCGRKSRLNKPYKYGYCYTDECIKLYKHEQRCVWLSVSENRKKERVYSQLWRENNREKYNTLCREWYAVPENKEKVKIKQREAMRKKLVVPENREKYNKQQREQKFKQYHAMTLEQRREELYIRPITEKQFIEIAIVWGMYKDEMWRCYICLEWFDRVLIEKEHILSRKRYKVLEKEPQNILPACIKCNGIKKNKVGYEELIKVFSYKKVMRITKEQKRVAKKFKVLIPIS